MKPVRSLLPQKKLRPSDEYDLTLTILGEMGSEAHSAIPFLIEEVRQPQHFHMGERGEVAMVLSKVLPGSGSGKEALSALKVSKKLAFLTPHVAAGLNQSIKTIEKSTDEGESESNSAQ